MFPGTFVVAMAGLAEALSIPVEWLFQSFERDVYYASDAAANDRFGSGVAVSGDGTRYVTGAPTKNSQQGSVYVFVKDANGDWTEEQIITAGANAENLSYFGESVDINTDGTRIVISHHAATESATSGAGAVYIYSRSGTTWSLEQRLVSSAIGAGLNFGTSVSIDDTGTRVAIGEANAQPGAIHVFSRSGTTWSHEQKVTHSSITGDILGKSISISGNGYYIISGHTQADPDGVSNSGSAWIFSRSGTTWTEQQKLIQNNKAINDNFGKHVKLNYDGSKAFVTAPGHSTDGMISVFSRSGSTWSLDQGLILTDDQDLNDNNGTHLLGRALDITDDGSYILAGSLSYNGLDTQSEGAAYLFKYNEDTSLYELNFKFRGHRGDRFSDAYTLDAANAVAISSDGSICVVGEGGNGDNLDDAGAVYVFDANQDWGNGRDLNWNNEIRQKVWQLDTDSTSLFGHSLNMSGDGKRVVVGAPNYNGDNGYSDEGKIYVYAFENGIWTEELALENPYTGVSNYQNFGESVNIDYTGSRIIVGEIGGVDGTEGRVSIYSRSDTTWTLEDTLTVSGSADMGNSVAFDKNATRAIIGAERAASNFGAAYIFTRSGTSWSLEQTLLASDGASGDQFGGSVDMDETGTRVVIGARADDTGASNNGQVYIFSRSGTTWSEEAVLSASDATSFSSFGSAVDIDGNGDYVVVGAEYQDKDGTITNSGKIYIFERTNTSWSEIKTFRARDNHTDQWFGAAVSIQDDGRSIAVGAPKDHAKGGSTDRGAAYIYEPL